MLSIAMKTKPLGTRVDEAFDARISAMERGTGVARATIMRTAMEAVVDYYEEHGGISFPLKVIPTSHLPTVEQIVSGQAPPNPTPGRVPTEAEMRAAWERQQGSATPRPADQTPEILDE